MRGECQRSVSELIDDPAALSSYLFRDPVTRLRQYCAMKEIQPSSPREDRKCMCTLGSLRSVHCSLPTKRPQVGPTFNLFSEHPYRAVNLYLNALLDVSTALFVLSV
jgi:hypothetical protein